MQHSRRAGFILVIAMTAAFALLALPSSAAAAPARHIVVLKDGASPGTVARQHTRRHNAVVSRVLRHAISGYVARLTPRAARRIARDHRVASVELDQRVRRFAQDIPTGISRSGAAVNTSTKIDGTDDVRVDVDVAVLDGGVDTTHADLHVVRSVDCLNSAGGGAPWARTYVCSDGAYADAHGTHVAGTIGAIDNGIGVVGVAPGARIWGVRVLGTSGGYMSQVVAGVDFVTAHAATIEVANMSLGCQCTSAALDAAIAASVDAGVVYVVAAGNDGMDAAAFSPANHPDVITVSALADFDGAAGGNGTATCSADEDDTLASFSNYGALIDIAAPGVCINSTVPGGYATYNGTSMAAPHVAGAAALLASGGRGPVDDAGVAALTASIVAAGNTTWTDDSGDGITERLLDVAGMVAVTIAGNGGGTEDPPAEDPPVDDPPVDEQPVDDWGLDGAGTKVKGVRFATLSWTIAATAAEMVDVYRDGTLVTTIANDGTHEESVGKGGASVTYRVCAAASTTACSADVVVNFG